MASGTGRSHAWLLKVGTAIAAVVAIGLFVTVGVVAGADQPSISSDRSDYAPGDPVVLTGAGWQAAETVEILVDDDQDDPWSHEAELVAGDDGTVSGTFDLPDVAGDFSITATAQSGTASASFTVTETTETEPEPEPTPPCVATGDETLATDKPDYLPGGRVALTGSGYEPACELTLRITLPGETFETETFATDTDGSVSYVYALPSPACPASTSPRARGDRHSARERDLRGPGADRRNTHELDLTGTTTRPARSSSSAAPAGFPERRSRSSWTTTTATRGSTRRTSSQAPTGRSCTNSSCPTGSWPFTR